MAWLNDRVLIRLNRMQFLAKNKKLVIIFFFKVCSKDRKTLTETNKNVLFLTIAIK
jgi:hypothetical protein